MTSMKSLVSHGSISGLLCLMLKTFKWKRFGSFVSGGLDLKWKRLDLALFSYSSSGILGQAEALPGYSESFDYTLIIFVFDFIL